MKVFTLFIICYLWCAVGANISTTGTYYDEIELPDAIKIDEPLATGVFIDQSFHICSLRDGCNYIIKDTRNNEYTLLEKEADIPANKDFLRIWRKMQGLYIIHYDIWSRKLARNFFVNPGLISGS